MSGLKKKVNVKLSRCTSSGHACEWIYSSIHFCPWFQFGVPGHVSAPANLPPRNEPLYTLSERMDGPQSGSGRLSRKKVFASPRNQIMVPQLTSLHLGLTFFQLMSFFVRRHRINKSCFKEKHLNKVTCVRTDAHRPWRTQTYTCTLRGRCSQRQGWDMFLSNFVTPS